ncbi:hypothetical protein JW835_12660 [bacterium]|nr:hypothetical protein [bacterium]
MKKQLIITMILLQSSIVFCQSEFISPDGKKQVVIQKTADKQYQVIVNSKPHKSYQKIINQYIYFFTDSSQVAYIAKSEYGYCVVVDGIEQRYYKEIYNNTLTFSPDRSRYGYLATKFSGLLSARTCCVIDGKEQQEYDNFASFGITFSPDSKHWAYAAFSDNKWFYIIDGAEQPRYDFVAENNITFSQDGDHWAYGASKDNHWFYVVDGKEQPLYNGVDLASFMFSSDSRHWAYSAQIDKEWACILDGRISSYEESSLCSEIKKTAKPREIPEMKIGVSIGLNLQHFSGFKIKNKKFFADLFGNTTVGGGTGPEAYIGLGIITPDLNNGIALEFGFSKYNTNVTFNDITKEYSVNTFFWGLKFYVPANIKLKPYMYAGAIHAVLDIDDLGRFSYTIEDYKGYDSYTSSFIANSKYDITIINLGFGYRYYFLRNLCFQGSVSLAYLIGKASKYSYGMGGGGLPKDFTSFNVYYDFGFEIIL